MVALLAFTNVPPASAAGCTHCMSFCPDEPLMIEACWEECRMLNGECLGETASCENSPMGPELINCCGGV